MQKTPVNQGFGLFKGEIMTDTWRQVKSAKPDTDPLTDLKKEIEELIGTSKAVLEAKEKAATKTSNTTVWVGTGQRTAAHVQPGFVHALEMEDRSHKGYWQKPPLLGTLSTPLPPRSATPPEGIAWRVLSIAQSPKEPYKALQ